MGSLNLPAKDSPEIRLVTATQEEQDAQQIVNSGEWRGALSLEAYLRREKFLFNQDLTRDGGISPWVLVHQPDKNGPRQVLCGCETIRKQAVVAKDGKVEDVICHSVASVFCPPQYRGRGYAGRMMADLGEQLKSWQTDHGDTSLFSVLYSDIGKEFYAARGWHPFPSAHLTLHGSKQPTLAPARLLNKQDLPELCATDEVLLRDQLPEVKTERGPTVAVALIPDHRTLAWHHAREEFVAQELYGKTPVVKGAVVGTTPGSRVWAYFTRVWANPQEESPSTLHILRLVVEDKLLPDASPDFEPATEEGAAQLKGLSVVNAIVSILRVAQHEAAEWDMKEVSIWNPTSATLAAVQHIDPDAAVVHRESESITSLQWYGEGSWKDVNWICNEKYGWN